MDHSAPHDKFDSFENFEAFFDQAENHNGYRIELAKLAFTREVINHMEKMDLKKGKLAEALGVQAGFVTRLLNGRNNFELATMVRLATALNCEFLCHLQPAGAKTQWFDVLNQTPTLQVASEYQKPSDSWKHINQCLDFDDERFPIAS